MDVCRKCKQIFENQENLKAIVCSGPCSGQFHNMCTNLNENEISSLKLSQNIKWFCEDCSKSLSGMKNGDNQNIEGNLFKILQIQENCLNNLEKQDFRAKDNINLQPKFVGTLIKLVIVSVFIIFTLLITFTIFRSRVINNENNSQILINITTDGETLDIINRRNWLAQPSINDLKSLNHPIERIIVIPTRTSECETQAACTYTVRIIQTYNIESMQQDDIIYNFLIGGDGNIYEGRGWDFKGSVLKGFNDDSLTFAYIGSFNKNSPSDKQLNVTKILLQEGIRLRKISPDYRIVGANQLEPTSKATLADALYKSFENWPHWSNK